MPIIQEATSGEGGGLVPPLCDREGLPGRNSDCRGGGRSSVLRSGRLASELLTFVAGLAWVSGVLEGVAKVMPIGPKKSLEKFVKAIDKLTAV